MRVVCDVHISNARLIALFDQHWAALREVFDESRCYAEIGALGLRVFKSPIAQ